MRDLGEDVEIGCEPRKGAVEEHEIFHIEHEFLGHTRAVAKEHLHDLLHFFDHFVGIGRGGVDARTVESEVFDNRVNVGVRRKRSEIAERRDLHVDVVHGGTEHEAKEGAALTLVHAAGDAEIQQGNFSIGKDEEVSAMEVTVEDAFDDGAFHESDHPGAYDFVRIDTCITHRLNIIEVEAGKTFHDKHAASDKRGVRPRNDVAVLLEGNKGCGNVEHVLCFETEVEFLADRFGKELNQCRWVGE